MKRRPPIVISESTKDTVQCCPQDCPYQLPKRGLRSQQQPNRMIEEVIETRGFARKNDDGRNADRRLANRRFRPLSHLTARAHRSSSSGGGDLQVYDGQALAPSAGHFKGLRIVSESIRPTRPIDQHEDQQDQAADVGNESEQHKPAGLVLVMETPDLPAGPLARNRFLVNAARDERCRPRWPALPFWTATFE